MYFTITDKQETIMVKTNEILALDLKPVIFEATRGFFSTMLSIALPPPDEISQDENKEHHYVGCVYIIGDVFSGLFEISLTEEFGRLMAANMLGLSIDDIKSNQDVLDVLQEAANIIGGNLKSRLCDNDFKCKISPPSVFDSNAYKINSKEWLRSDSFQFQYEEHTFYVKAYMKPES